MRLVASALVSTAEAALLGAEDLLTIYVLGSPARKNYLLDEFIKFGNSGRISAKVVAKPVTYRATSQDELEFASTISNGVHPEPLKGSTVSRRSK
jgi:hypothetical protein